MKRILSILLILLMVLTLNITASAATINNTEEIETMALREIPEGAVEIQTGLWAHQTHSIVNGVQYSRYTLYSAVGYCFYDLTDQYYDEYGNLIPEDEVQPNQRVYYQYMSLSALTSTVDELNARFVSVPVQDGYEIVSVGNNTVTQ